MGKKTCFHTNGSASMQQRKDPLKILCQMTYRSNISASPWRTQAILKKIHSETKTIITIKDRGSLAAHSSASAWIKDRAHKVESQPCIGFPKFHTFYSLFYLLPFWLHFSRWSSRCQLHSWEKKQLQLRTSYYGPPIILSNHYGFTIQKQTFQQKSLKYNMVCQHK